MKVGLALGVQNTADWDRYLASERHEQVPSRPARADADLWDEGISIGLEAEPLGFDSVFCPEHHFTPYSFGTNPLQILSYLAGRTERIDLGTMVVVLPWNQPLRVAEQATMLQNLLGSERELLLGLGRGLARREYEAFGIDMSESRQRFKESVEILRLALSQDRFSYDGVHFKIPETALRPYPRDGRVLDNLYCAWGSPQSAPIAGELGLKPFIIPQKPMAQYEEEMAVFARVRAEHGYQPQAPMLVTWVYCAETADAAREGALEHMREYVRTPLHHYELLGDHFAKRKGYEHYAGTAKVVQSQNIDLVEAMTQTWLDNHVWGTPEQCYDKIVALHKTWSPSHLVTVTQYGQMSLADAQKNTRLFAREVLPAAQALQDPDSVSAGV